MSERFRCKDCIYHDGEINNYWGIECTEPHNQSKWNQPKWKSTLAMFKRDSAPVCKRFKLRVYLAGGWTQEEVVYQYRIAKDKKKQIKVMSQLCGVEEHTIKDILITNGIDIEGMKKNRKK